jgi:hypothetical protein
MAETVQTITLTSRSQSLPFHGSPSPSKSPNLRLDRSPWSPIGCNKRWLPRRAWLLSSGKIHSSLAFPSVFATDYMMPILSVQWGHVERSMILVPGNFHPWQPRRFLSRSDRNTAIRNRLRPSRTILWFQSGSCIRNLSISVFSNYIPFPGGVHFYIPVQTSDLASLARA